MVAGPTIFPSISDVEIDRRAGRLLSEYSGRIGLDIQVPVPVEVIAEQYLGYDIEIVGDGLFSNPDYLGGIIFDQKIIQVNAELEKHEGRYNFTLAHEIGHHVLHRDIYMAGLEEESCDIICRDTVEKDLVEVQADRFAASLLMPEAVVRHVVENMSFKFVASVKGLRVMAAKVIQQGGFSNVSNAAMVNRLIELGYAKGAAYQTGTSRDFPRGRGHNIRRNLPPSIQKLLRNLYQRYRHRLTR